MQADPSLPPRAWTVNSFITPPFVNGSPTPWTMKTLPLVAILFFSVAAIGQSYAAVIPDTLRCNGLEDPLGVDSPTPELSWEMNNDQPATRGIKQTAYQILVASTPGLLAQDQGDLWESGRVDSDQSLNIVYAGKPLGSLAHVFWKVQVWDQNQIAS